MWTKLVYLNKKLKEKSKTNQHEFIEINYYEMFYIIKWYFI
jgi:hypothetical protein